LAVSLFASTRSKSLKANPKPERTIVDFADFWNLYPLHIARKRAERSWARLTEKQRFAAVESLPVHIRYWEAAGTTKEFLPYCSTWLNQERWEDELEMPKPKEIADAWWTSNEGIHRKALAEGMTARSGESYQDLKARILAKTRAA
jgi:hypothetical protein